MFWHKNSDKPVPNFRFFVILFLLVSSALAVPYASEAGEASAGEEQRLFTEFTPNSTVKIDYGPWTEVLKLTVWDTGPSDRTYAQPPEPRLGSRIADDNTNPTRLEANRVFYHLLGDEQIDFISEYKAMLEAMPSQQSLSILSRNEQLAYWLNLYTITVYEHIARAYPLTLLDDMREAGGFFDRKVLNVEGVSLSLREVEQRVISNWDDPLVIYGLFQGTIGGPNIPTRAYTGAEVFQQLESNAHEFINSLRGLRFADEEARASVFYRWNSSFFADFESDLRRHLMRYADADVGRRLVSSSRLVADVYDWYIADLYNGRFSTGAANANTAVMSDGRAPQSAFGRVAPPSGYPEHVQVFIQEIRIRNATNRRGNVNIEEAESETTIVESPDDEDEAGY
jgi:Protein of unknown function, DUF547